MKGTLYCNIFGHKFIARVIVDGPLKHNGVMVRDGYRNEFVEYRDNCQRCGLTKKELGIGV